VTGNIFQASNSGSYRAFYINPGVNNFTFSENAITGNFAYTATTQAKNGLVENNMITGAGGSAGFRALGEPDPTVWGHTTFSGNIVSGVARGITVDEANNVTITGNTLSGNGIGVRVVAYSSIPFDITTISIHNNNLSGEDIYGVINEIATTTKVNASSNWWGSATPVFGSLVSGAVSYSPWCADINCTILYPDTTPPKVISVTPNQTAKTITYNFDEPVQLTDSSYAVVSPSLVSGYASYLGIYNLVDYIAHVTGTPGAPATTGVITKAVLSSDGKTMIITYDGLLIKQTDTTYIVDAWGYNITDLAGNKMLPDALSQSFIVAAAAAPAANPVATATTNGGTGAVLTPTDTSFPASSSTPADTTTVASTDTTSTPEVKGTSTTNNTDTTKSDPGFFMSTWLGIYNWIWLLGAAAAVAGGAWWLFGTRRQD